MTSKATKVLVKIDTDWADEFTVRGYEIMTLAEWQEIKSFAAKVKWPKEIYYGSNEYYTIDSVEDFNQAVKATPISEGEAATLTRLLGKHYGMSLPDIAYLIEEDE